MSWNDFNIKVSDKGHLKAACITVILYFIFYQQQAREILELGLQNVSYALQVVALTDGKSIADIGWVKVRSV